MVTVNSAYYPSCPRQQWDARSSPPMTVARALREQCNIPFESFFLATHMGGGQFAYFSGPRPISEEDIRGMFRRDKFLQFQNRASTRESLSRTHEDDHYQDTAGAIYSDNPPLHLSGQWEPQSTRRKRPRRSGMLGRDVDNDAPPVITSSKQPLEIGNSDTVWAFYDHRFRCVQQTACKEIAKAFIKVLAPKKQANNPYTRGDATAPWWWPKPWGPGEKDKVRHLEPDHQWKKERVHLLVHILKLVIETPERQHPDIQRLEINAARLETVAMESLSSWFEDRSKAKNAKKKPILKEIFKVAKMQEKYMRNEIDATTQVFVTADDMVMDFCFDPDDEEDDEEEQAAGVRNERSRTDSVTSSAISPTRATAMPHAILPGLPSTASTAQALDAAAQIQATPFMYNLPIRGQDQYDSPAMMPSDLAQDQYAYSESASTATVGGQPSLQAHTTAALQMHDLLAGPHHAHATDTSRRASLFNSSTHEFTGAPPPTMYHSPWTQTPSQQDTPTPAVTTPETSSLYAYPVATAAHHHHQQTAPPAPPPLLPMPHHHHHHHQQQQQQQQQEQPATQYAGHYGTTATAQFDGIPQHQQHHRTPTENQPQPHSQTLFRSGTIQLTVQPHHHQQHRVAKPDESGVGFSTGTSGAVVRRRTTGQGQGQDQEIVSSSSSSSLSAVPASPRRGW